MLKILAIGTLLMLVSCGEEIKEESSGLSRKDFADTWKLVSRTDKDSSGKIVMEPTLGSDPVSFLFYDTLGNLSVQIMKRNRMDNVITPQSTGGNNSVAFNGYDAYFGKYEYDTSNKKVVHIVEGAINPADLGKKLERSFNFAGDSLALSFSTTNSGKQVTRTLTFVRQQ